jgi:hypothetical protein
VLTAAGKPERFPWAHQIVLSKYLSRVRVENGLDADLLDQGRVLRGRVPKNAGDDQSDEIVRRAPGVNLAAAQIVPVRSFG